jgi:hypothetical protein
MIKIQNNHKMMRVPAPKGRSHEGTAIIDENGRLVAYSQYIISINDKNPQFDWVRKDSKL